ncbi:hypothetical protein [Modicisalibacter luteus]|uniref:hypothetical protein n=1 Tax=Modicisalibacter luteus TaxID=453962 RepID=UPI003644CEAC
MDVYNLRPLADQRPGLALGGVVYETIRAIDDTGWYLQATYTFHDTPWRPQVLYRHAEFSERYDRCSFCGRWSNWFMGEFASTCCSTVTSHRHGQCIVQGATTEAG